MKPSTSWRARVADEFREQRGAARKAWWVARFALASATLGNADLGIAALGNGKAKFERALRKAAELDRLRDQATPEPPRQPD